MIEFNGCISGKAKKHFIKKCRRFVQILLFIGMLFFCPTICYFAIKNKSNFLIELFVYCFIGMFGMTYIPKSKKEEKSLTPRKIFVSDETIVCIADKYTESQSIHDVKKIKDYGDFYDLIFPIGRYSEKFICQKELLSKGTLEEFEALFEGKIERK